MTEGDRDEREKPEEIVNEILGGLDYLHSKFVDKAMNIARKRDAFASTRPIWQRIGEIAGTSGQGSDLVSSGLDYLRAARDEVNAGKAQVDSTQILSPQFLGSTDMILTVSGSTAMITFGDCAYEIPPGCEVTPVPTRRDSLRQKLASLDPALAKTYEEVWEALYGTRADPERASLYLVRQTYDHFFSILAPDDQVRKSQFWTRKSGDHPDQVIRQERMTYAAHIHIRDPSRRNTLLAASRHMIKVYRSLNAAHKRGRLHPGKAHGALQEMCSLIEDWAEALET